MLSVKKHYDYIIIGAGSGGLAAGIGLKKIGKDVLIVGKTIGGECTQTGCIPSKTFLSLAMHYVWKSEKKCNLELRQGIFDRIRAKVKELEKHDEELMNVANIPFLQGYARFVNNHTIEVEPDPKHPTANGYSQKKKITFNTCIIATGSRPQKIHIEGLPEKKILTNDNLFKLKELPNRVVIFGGGPIGTENGTAFAKFCTHTTIVVRSEMIPTEPRECVEVVKKSLIEEFEAHIYENVKETIYDTETGHLLLKDQNGNEIAKVPQADYYLMALGRLPNTEQLDLEKAGIEYDKAGISVNENFLTSNKRVFAIGDVTDSPKFTHLAVNQATFVVKQIGAGWLQKLSLQKNETPLPACTYSDPPIASVGDKQETGTIKKFVIDFGKSDRGRVEEAQGLIGCIYVDMVSGKITGASLVGHFAEHVINFFTLAIIKDFKVTELNNFMVPYPTYFSGIDHLQAQFLEEKSLNEAKYRYLWLKEYMWQILVVISFMGLLLFLLVGMVFKP